MALIFTFLVALSLQATAIATTVTFSKIGYRVYVETDPQHYALYGQVSDKQGFRAIAVNGDTLAYQTKECDTDWSSMSKIKKDYSEIRGAHLEVRNKSPAISNTPTQSYIWTDTLSSDKEDYSEVKLDDKTFVVSSKYFPSKLAKVIISDDVFIFVHNDGRVALKTEECLFLNERILVAGIYRDYSGQWPILLPSTRGKALKKHLSSKKFNEDKFNSEQEYYKTYTSGEIDHLVDKVKGRAFAWSEGWKP